MKTIRSRAAGRRAASRDVFGFCLAHTQAITQQQHARFFALDTYLLCVVKAQVRPQVLLCRLLDAGGVDGAHALWPRAAAQVVAGHVAHTRSG
jgi:hypothetical protein